MSPSEAQSAPQRTSEPLRGYVAAWALVLAVVGSHARQEWQAGAPIHLKGIGNVTDIRPPGQAGGEWLFVGTNGYSRGVITLDFRLSEVVPFGELAWENCPVRVHDHREPPQFFQAPNQFTKITVFDEAGAVIRSFAAAKDFRIRSVHDRPDGSYVILLEHVQQGAESRVAFWNLTGPAETVAVPDLVLGTGEPTVLRSGGRDLMLLPGLGQLHVFDLDARAIVASYEPTRAYYTQALYPWLVCEDDQLQFVYRTTTRRLIGHGERNDIVRIKREEDVVTIRVVEERATDDRLGCHGSDANVTFSDHDGQRWLFMATGSFVQATGVGISGRYLYVCIRGCGGQQQAQRLEYPGRERFITPAAVAVSPDHQQVVVGLGQYVWVLERSP